MAGKRRRHTDEFKARVALEAVRGVKTGAELSSAYRVHLTVIAHWKKQLVMGAPRVFASGSWNGKSEEDVTGPLYEENRSTRLIRCFTYAFDFIPRPTSANETRRHLIAPTTSTPSVFACDRRRPVQISTSHVTILPLMGFPPR